MRFGLYICWVPTVACPGLFNEVFTVDSTPVTLLTQVPFLQVFDDSANSNWKAAKNNKHWCKANFESQCSLQQGIDCFFVALKKEAMQRNDKYMLSALLPTYAEELTYDNLELCFLVKEDILEEAKRYVAESKTLGQITVGLHLRRGDHKYFNCNQRAAKLPGQKGQEVLDQWYEADQEFEDRPTNRNDTLFI